MTVVAQYIGLEWALVVTVAALAIVFGGLGGLAAHFVYGGRPQAQGLSHPTISVENDQRLLGWQSVFIGSIGALGFLFFVLAVGGLGAESGFEEKVRLISTSVIAGFGARRLLPNMVGNLEKQMAQVAQKADRAASEAHSAERQSDRLEVNINLKEAAQKTASAKTRSKAIAEAKKLIAANNASSATWVALARVFRWDGKIETAIVTLDQGLTAIEQGDVDGDNLAVLYYNRACYRALMYEDASSASEKAKLIADLEHFFSLTEDPKKEAEIIFEDADWSALVDDPDFLKVINKWKGA